MWLSMAEQFTDLLEYCNIENTMMIPGTNCGQCGEMLRDFIHRI
jgi:bacterioferritin-associated ferredoxin